MGKFEEVYKQILSQHLGQKIDQLNPLLIEAYKPQHQYFDRYKIINQIVKSKKLIPVPNSLIKQINNNIEKLNSNVYKIDYKQLINIVKQSEYTEAQTFIQNFEEHTKDINGTLYIVYFELDENDNVMNNKTLNLILQTVEKDQLACDFFNEILNHPKTVKGLNIVKSYEDIEKYKDTLIFINKNNITDWFAFLDILDHQLTHFIQRITNFEDKVKIIKRDYAHNSLNKDQRKILDKFVYKQENRMLVWTMIIDKFSDTEYVETIKDIINFFKRFYIREGKRKDKLTWLNNFLTSINNYSYFQKHNLIDQFNDYLDSKDKIQTFNITFVLICICYFVLKLNYDIDNLLKEQFKNDQDF